MKNKLTLQDIESKIKDKKFTILEDGKQPFATFILKMDLQ